MFFLSKLSACPILLATDFWQVLAQSRKKHASIVFREYIVRGLYFIRGDF